MHFVLASPLNSAVYKHWLEARKESGVPLRSDIDPEQIKHQLPYVYIAEVKQDDGGTWFKFRLMGTRLVNTLKQEGTGKFLLDLQIGGWEEEWRINLLQTLRYKLPVVDESTVRTGCGHDLDIEHLCLPLSSDGVEVDRLMGAIDFLPSTRDTLRNILPTLDWAAIDRVHLEKRVVIQTLRVSA